jgi:hypothetical protein
MAGAADLAAALVGQSATGDAEKPIPGLRLRWDVGAPPPGDQEGLGEDVGGVLAVGDTAQRVGEDRAAVVGVEPAEADLGELAREGVLGGGGRGHQGWASG